MSTIGHHTDARGATVTHIRSHIANFVVGLLEAIYKSWVHLGEWRVSSKVMVYQVFLQMTFDEHGESMLQE